MDLWSRVAGLPVYQESKETQETGEKKSQKSCVHCKRTNTPMWRCGPAGPKSLCNACGIRYRKQKTMSLNGTEYRPKVVKKRKYKRRIKKPTTASPDTNCSSTNIAFGTSTCNTTAKSASGCAATNNGKDASGGRNALKVVKFVMKRKKVKVNKHKVVKTLKCYQRRRRTNFQRTCFYFLEDKWWKLGEEEQAAVALLALSNGCSVFSRGYDTKFVKGM